MLEFITVGPEVHHHIKVKVELPLCLTKYHVTK